MKAPYSNEPFDTWMESFFDAADALLSPKPLLVAAILVNPLVSTALAGDCHHIPAKDDLLLYGYPAAHVDMDIDSVKREVCVKVLPLDENLSVEPSNLCVSIDEDEQQPVFLKYPSGASLDVSSEFSSEYLRYVYDFNFKSCKGQIGRIVNYEVPAPH